MQTAPNAGIPQIATDPPVSEAQRKAMYAALHGHSTLGIPKSVAEKFVGEGHDAQPDDLTRGAGVALREPSGKLLLVKRNGTGDQSGTWAFPGGYARQGESEEAAAIRELAEEIGFNLQKGLKVRFDSERDDGFRFTTFAHDLEEPFEPVLNDEASEYRWASLDDLPQPLHPGVDAMLREIGSDPVAGSAMDERFAFDRASVRTTDADGRLHVAVTNISKANICPYLGREIPDWQRLGLQPDRIYKLLRDPDELRKAAATFNNLPLLSQHVPVSAADHQPDLVIGSTGTDAEFSHPYLKNSLVVWAKDAIDLIESEAQKELSSAYRYEADMTPGTYVGENYDGVMRKIVGNHVALVKEGRAGTDVVVGDSKPAVIAQNERTISMSTAKLSRTGAFVGGALTAFLLPKLAQDARMPDLAPVLDGVTSANFAEMKPKIIEGVTAAFKDVKLAKDANLEDMHGFIDRLDKLEDKAAGQDEDVDEEDKKKGAFDAEQAEGLRNFLKDKLSEDNMKALDAYLAGDEPPAFAGTPVKEGQDEENEQVDKKAMDAAIKSAAEEATKIANANQQAIREAERFVRPYVGELAVAYDSAEAVHRAAAKVLGIKNADTVHKDALPVLIESHPVLGAKPKTETTVAMDAATIDDFHKRYPGAARIGIM